MRKKIIALMTTVSMFLFTSCSSVDGRDDSSENTPVVLTVQPKIKQEEIVKEKPVFQQGHGSWYGKEFHGKRTSSGEKFDMNKLTAAHKKLPFGTVLEVTNLNNGKKVVVTVNDRGPASKKRVLDLSQSAFGRISDTEVGIIPLEIRVLSVPKEKS